MGKHLISVRYIFGLMVIFVLAMAVYYIPYIQTGQAQGQSGSGKICTSDVGNVWTVSGTVHQGTLFNTNTGAITNPDKSNLKYKQRYCYKKVDGKNKWLPAERWIEGHLKTSLPFYTIFFGEDEIKSAVRETRKGEIKRDLRVADASLAPAVLERRAEEKVKTPGEVGKIENAFNKIKMRCATLLGENSADFHPLNARLLVNEGAYLYSSQNYYNEGGNSIADNKDDGKDHAETQNIRLYGCAYVSTLADIILLSPYSVVDDSGQCNEEEGSWFKDNKYCVKKVISKNDFQTKVCGRLGGTCGADASEWWSGHHPSEDDNGGAGVRTRVVIEGGKISFGLYGCGRSIKTKDSLGFWSFGVDNSRGNEDKGYGCRDYRQEIQCGSRGQTTCGDNSRSIQEEPGGVAIPIGDRKLPNFGALSYEAKRVGTRVNLPNTTCGDGRVFRDVIATDGMGNKNDDLTDAQKSYLIKAKEAIEKSGELQTNVQISVANSPIEYLTLVCHDELFGSDFVGPISAINVQTASIHKFSVSPTVLTQEYIEDSSNNLDFTVEVFNGDYRRKADIIDVATIPEAHPCKPSSGEEKKECYVGGELLCEVKTTRERGGQDNGLLDRFVTSNTLASEKNKITKEYHFSTPLQDETYKVTCWKCSASTPTLEKKLIDVDSGSCQQYGSLGVKKTKVKKGNPGFKELATKRVSVKVLSDVYLERRLGQSSISITLKNGVIKIDSKNKPIQKIFIDGCQLDLNPSDEISITKNNKGELGNCGKSDDDNFNNKNPLLTVQVRGVDGRLEAPVGKRLCWANEVFEKNSSSIKCVRQ